MSYTGLVSHTKEETIKRFYISIDQMGEEFDDPEARLAFLYVAIADVAGEEALNSAHILHEKFNQFGGQTLPAAVVNGEQEDLKDAIAVIIHRYKAT